MMADYNGWADEREEEREALDQLDLTLATDPAPRQQLQVLRGLLLRVKRKGSGAGSPIVYIRSPMRRTSRRQAVGGTRHQPHPLRPHPLGGGWISADTAASTGRACITVWGAMRERVVYTMAIVVPLLALALVTALVGESSQRVSERRTSLPASDDGTLPAVAPRWRVRGSESLRLALMQGGRQAVEGYG
jgi:hypothetical protein